MYTMEPKRIVWSMQERAILLNLVNKHRKVIEIKKTDCISVAHKKRTWATLALEFNSMPETTKRTVGQLRKCWENVKARRKKKMAETNRVVFKTSQERDPDLVKIELNPLDADIYDETQLTQSFPTAGCSSDNDILNDEIEEHFVEEVSPIFSNSVFVSREKEFDRNLQISTDRSLHLQLQDEETHALKMEVEVLKRNEQTIKIEEAEIRKRIAQEVYTQEKIKTQILQIELNKLLNK